MNDPNSIIEAQKEQITRYQSRLKDVVLSYKSLLKEKEALDISIAALSIDKSDNINNGSTSDAESSKQIQTIMSSLATLSAEKSRMEASFQASQKNIRQEMALKDKEIKDLNEKLKSTTLALGMEKENFKAKLIYYDRMLADERHLKENLETQLNQLKTQFSQTSNSDKIIKELTQELSEAKKKLKAYESNQNKFTDDSSVMQALQSEMEELKQQHLTDLMAEKQRANQANERSRKLTVLHEERVQNLEARLSDLSASVAHYHNLRESDQMNIVQLKDRIAQLSRGSEEILQEFESSHSKVPNVHALIEEIERMKHLLIYENTKLETPIDLSFILSRPPFDVTLSAEKYSILKQDCDKFRAENETLKLTVKDQNEHIKTLKEKVQVLNQNIDDFENEIKSKSFEISNELKAERNKWRETTNSMEVEHRSKISQLEQQLQKQRERSLVLLEEKENEIRTLKTSYELFIPKKSSISSQHEEDDGQWSECSGRRKASHSQHLGMVLNQMPASSTNLPETHMIYYSNELARKDLELSTIRKAKREAENLIRQTLKEKIMLQEELDDRIVQLEQQVDRLERSKSREGSNIEYLKNVTLSYLTTSDLESKKKMMNAIGAVLRFDDSEFALISNSLGKKK